MHPETLHVQILAIGAVEVITAIFVLMAPPPTDSASRPQNDNMCVYLIVSARAGTFPGVRPSLYTMKLGA